MFVSINGTIGSYAFYNNEKIILGKSACYFNLMKKELQIYMKFLIQSKYFIDYALLNATGSTIKNVSLKTMNNLLIPLPPLSEQQRIVAKIEELMPLVEDYDKAQKELNDLNEKLPEQLKKSILQQAIMGKLVPQDPADEPASVLLQRIRKEKEQLVKEGKLKKKDLETSPIADDEKPFDIPESWEWCRLGELVSNRAGLAYSKGDLDVKNPKMVRVLRGGNITCGQWRIEDNDVMISPEFVDEELYLKSGTFITPAVTSLENMGKTALIEQDLDDTVVGGFVLMLEAFYKKTTFLKYLLYFFQSAYYKEICKSITNKSGQAFYNLSRKKMMEILVPIPSLNSQCNIVSKVEELFALLEKK